MVVSRKVDRFWKVGAGLVTAGLLVLGLIQVLVQFGHDELVEVETFDAGGITTVDVDTRAGRVRVIGGDVDTITVTAEITHGLELTSHTRRVEGDRLVLDARCPGFFSDYCRVDYAIEMPADLGLVVRSEETVTLIDLSGEVDVEVSDGDIHAERLAGPARLHSRFATVTAVDLRSSRVDARAHERLVLGFTDPPRDVQAHSRYDRVDVAVPDDGEPYDVQAESRYGILAVGTVRHDPDSPRLIDARGYEDVAVRHHD